MLVKPIEYRELARSDITANTGNDILEITSQPVSRLAYDKSYDIVVVIERKRGAVAGHRSVGGISATLL